MDDGQDGFDAGDLLLTSTAVDDVWSGGQAELWRALGAGTAQAFDSVKIWLDNDANGTLDAGDDVQVDDDFSSATVALTYDAAGNLTSDGVLGYVYDAWNRLVQVQRAAAGDTTTVATYAYDGQNRRVSKTVTDSGPEVYPDCLGPTRFGLLGLQAAVTLAMKTCARVPLAAGHLVGRMPVREANIRRY